MGSMSKDNGTLSFWEVVAKVDKDDYLYDIKQKVFNHRLLKILRKGTVEDRQDILKYICKEQVKA